MQYACHLKQTKKKIAKRAISNTSGNIFPPPNPILFHRPIIVIIFNNQL